MSIRKRVDIKNAILQAVDSTSEMYLKNLPTLMKWAKQSYIRINGYTSLDPAIHHTTAYEIYADLPDDAVMVNLVFFGNINMDLGQWNNYRWLTDLLETNSNGVREFYRFTAGASIQPSGIPWQIQNNKIVFDVNLNDQELTIIYLKIQSDIKGMPLIEEEQVEAIGKFIEVNLAEKENHKKFVAGRLKNQDLIYVKTLRNNYHRLVGASRPKPTNSETQLVSRLLNNPWTGSSTI